MDTTLRCDGRDMFREFAVARTSLLRNEFDESTTLFARFRAFAVQPHFYDSEAAGKHLSTIFETMQKLNTWLRFAPNLLLKTKTLQV